MAVTENPPELREEAVKRLNARQDFHAHLLVYALVIGVLWLIWGLTTPGGFPWPAIVMAGWGIGLVMNWWDVYRRRPFSEADVAREIERLRGS